MLFFHFKSSARLDYFGHIGRRLDKKAKVSFKMFNVIDRETITVLILPNIS